MINLKFYLIHNGGERSIKALSMIARFIEKIDCTKKIEEIFWQSSKNTIGWNLLFISGFKFFFLRVKWSIYSERGFFSVLRVSISAPIFLIGYFFGVNTRNKRAVEGKVSNKHIRAWKKFCESLHEFAIICEDDVVIETDSLARFSQLVLGKIEVSQMIYIDLAGGCDLSELTVDGLVDVENGSVIVAKKPFTNTACAYLVSRPLVLKFLECLKEAPEIEFYPIDWLINSIFIKLEANDFKINCLHFKPPIFSHGSAVGVYKSWQAY